MEDGMYSVVMGRAFGYHMEQWVLSSYMKTMLFLFTSQLAHIASLHTGKLIESLQLLVVNVAVA